MVWKINHCFSVTIKKSRIVFSVRIFFISVLASLSLQHQQHLVNMVVNYYDQCWAEISYFYCSVGSRCGRPPPSHSAGLTRFRTAHSSPTGCAIRLCLPLRTQTLTAWCWAQASQHISHRPANSCLMASKCYEPMLDLFSLPTRGKLCVVLCHQSYPTALQA